MNTIVKEFFVCAAWDDEAKVWFVVETDVPGLVTEAPSLDALAGKLSVMIPEMLELNGFEVPDPRHVSFGLTAKFDGAAGHC